MKAYQIINSSNCVVGVVSEEELEELMEDGTVTYEDTIKEVELEEQ